MNNYEQWVGIDWGTTNVRFWLLATNGTTLDEVVLPLGMNTVTSGQYENIILDTITKWSLRHTPLRVITCGMLGAKNGWFEAPYLTTTCDSIDCDKLYSVQTNSSTLDVKIIPGIANYRPTYDVMRGEETQIKGFVTQNPDFEGVLCLPGTHTKWVHIKNSIIVSFQTFMTGELFDLLSHHSVLRHSVDTQLVDEEEFINAVDDTLSRPELFAQRLFYVRARSLLANTSKEKATSRLLGTLIGTELAGSKPYWLGHKVALIGSKKLTGMYQRALDLTGLETEVFDATENTILGLKYVHDRLAKEIPTNN